MKLIKNQKKVDKDKLTLLCLPFAGGGASTYNNWMERMRGKLNVCPIQLPGREERIMEKPYEDMSVMLDDLEQEVLSVIKGPYALWGHSMGAKIAYELEKRMEKSGYIAKCFFVSGSRVPHIPESAPIYHLSDVEFKRELKRFEGIPKAILDNTELLDFFLPMLRADFAMDETYCSEMIEPLKCSIVAFGGDSDKEASIEDIKAWNDYSLNSFSYQIFSGGHFYVREHEEEIIETIINQL